MIKFLVLALLRIDVIARSFFCVALDLYNLFKKRFHTYSFYHQNMAIKEIHQSVLNRWMLENRLNQIWPFWIREAMFDNASFLVTFPVCVSNSSRRNWHVLGASSHSYAYVDEYGLLVPSKSSWSIDFWLYDTDKIVPQSEWCLQRRSVDANGCVIMVYTYNAISIYLEFFSKNTNGIGLVTFSKIVLKNTSEDEQDFSIMVALRPYNTEGYAPIYSLSYLEGVGVVVNNHLGIVLDHLPDNVVFLDGKTDVSLYGVKWEKILFASCLDGLASGLLNFKLHLKKEETYTLNFKFLGSKNNALLRGSFDFLKNKGKAKQDINNVATKMEALSFEKELAEIKSISKKLLIKMASIEGGGYVEPVQASLLQVIQRIEFAFYSKDKKENILPSLEQLEILRMLNYYGLSEYVGELLKKLIMKDKKLMFYFSKKLTPKQIAQLTILLVELAKLSSKKALIEGYVVFLKKVVKLFFNSMEKKMRLFLAVENKLSTDFVLSEFLWTLSAGHHLADLCQIIADNSGYEYFMVQFSILSELLLEACDLISHRYIKNPLLFYSVKNLYDYRLIENLFAVSDLNLSDKWQPYLKQTLDWVSLEFVRDSKMVMMDSFIGYSIVDTFYYVYVLLKKMVGKPLQVIDAINKYRTATFSWPDHVSFKTGGGSYGDGHSLMASTWFLIVMRFVFINEDVDGGLILHPYTSKDVFNDTGTISFSLFPTIYGVVSLSLILKGTILEGKYQFNKLKNPQHIILKLPFIIDSCDKLRISKKQMLIIPRDKEEIKFSAVVSDIDDPNVEEDNTGFLKFFDESVVDATAQTLADQSQKYRLSEVVSDVKDQVSDQTIDSSYDSEFTPSLEAISDLNLPKESDRKSNVDESE